MEQGRTHCGADEAELEKRVEFADGGGMDFCAWERKIPVPTIVIVSIDFLDWCVKEKSIFT